MLAAKRSILRGEHRPEQPFPSVRAIAANLKIHPNTAHKAVQILIVEQWLEARVGTGTVVASAKRPPDRGSRELVRHAADRLVVLARGDGVPLDAVIGDVREAWATYEPITGG